MIGRIIAFVACLLCAIPFWIISKYEKDSRDPVPFWSGDTSLKAKVTNVKEYNSQMCGLYQKCGMAFLITGLSFLVNVPIGVILLGADCTLGIYIVYRQYKKILSKYS